MDKDKTKKTDQSHTEENFGQQTLFNLSNFGNKKVEVQFTAERISTDGGLLFLKEVDKNIGIINRIAACLEDHRHQSYVTHDIKNLMNLRVMQIAVGYKDVNDCNELRNDGEFSLYSTESRQSKNGRKNNRLVLFFSTGLCWFKG